MSQSDPTSSPQDPPPGDVSPRATSESAPPSGQRLDDPPATAPDQPPATMTKKSSRRSFLMMLGIALNAIAGVLVSIPIIGYIFSPARKKAMEKSLEWISLGGVDRYPVGQTRLATYRNPNEKPWDGETAGVACWVRRISAEKWQVFAVNCTHLGCPVRWFPQSGLFMCPCHGGAYYADGARASGPPPRGLFEYEFKIESGELKIKAGLLPTLEQMPSVACSERLKESSCA